MKNFTVTVVIATHLDRFYVNRMKEDQVLTTNKPMIQPTANQVYPICMISFRAFEKEAVDNRTDNYERMFARLYDRK